MSAPPFDLPGHLKKGFREQRKVFSVFLFISSFWKKKILLLLRLLPPQRLTPRPGVSPQSLSQPTRAALCLGALWHYHKATQLTTPLGNALCIFVCSVRWFPCSASVEHLCKSAVQSGSSKSRGKLFLQQHSALGRQSRKHVQDPQRFLSQLKTEVCLGSSDAVCCCKPLCHSKGGMGASR